MHDLTEIKYYIGECRRVLPGWERRLAQLMEQRESIAKELADIDTEIAEARGHINAINKSLRECGRLQKLLLTEADAVEVLKTAHSKHQMRGMTYCTDSKVESMRFEKALNTLPGTSWYKPTQNEDGDWEIEIVKFPDSYRAFLFGEADK
jgi:chromosome segregation ATPase